MDTRRASSSTSATAARTRQTKPRTSCPGCGETHLHWSAQAWCIHHGPATLTGDGPFAVVSRCRKYTRGRRKGASTTCVYLFPTLTEAEACLERWRSKGCCPTCRELHRLDFLPGLFEVPAAKLARLQAAQDGAPSLQAYDEPETDGWNDTHLPIGYAAPGGHRLMMDALAQIHDLAREIGSDPDQCGADRGELLVPFDHMGRALVVLEEAIFYTEPIPSD